MPHLLDDFRHAYESERLAWLRRRVAVFGGVAGAAHLGLAAAVAGGGFDPGISLRALVGYALQAGLLLTLAWLSARRASGSTRKSVLSLLNRAIYAYTALALLPAWASTALIDRGFGLFGVESSTGPGAAIVMMIAAVHTLASLLVPWTPRESLRPLVPPLLAFAAVSLAAMLYYREPAARLVEWAVLVVLILSPGPIIAWLRGAAFRWFFLNRAAREGYRELVTELALARRIHERLLPVPIAEGPTRLHFAFEPMRQIGGDFLAASRPHGAGGPLTAVIVDVTGHGVAAALTVNRLHAQLAFLLADDPGASPGALLAHLNRYTALTLAPAGVFGTAAALRIDPAAGTLTYSGAGHPAMLLRRADGTSRDLDSGAAMLGLLEPADFDPAELTLPFAPGDSVLAFTDGATEAAHPDGRQIGPARLAALALAAYPAQAPERWAAAVLGAVRALRQGPPLDDTLVVALFRADGP